MSADGRQRSLPANEQLSKPLIVLDAAMVQEVSAASEAIVREAHTLTQMISRYRLGRSGAADPGVVTREVPDKKKRLA